jgi:predicted lipoprotein with Yx(FWY)xxD motif
MKRMHQRKTTRRIPCGRLAIAGFAVGGLCASVFAVSNVGAMTSRTARSVVVSIVKNGQFGKILVSGKTLYTLKPSKMVCTAECTKIWPELVLPKGVSKAKAGSGVSASKLGTVKRKGGVRQVTYAGKALYWFSGDTSTGQVNGNVTDMWGKWSVVVTAKLAQSPVSTPSGVTTIPTPPPTVGTSPTKSGSSPTTTAPRAPASTTPTTSSAPTTTPPTSPPPTTTPTTSPPPTTTTTTTTTAPGSGGGVGF